MDGLLRQDIIVLTFAVTTKYNLESEATLFLATYREQFKSF